MYLAYEALQRFMKRYVDEENFPEVPELSGERQHFWKNVPFKLPANLVP